jgi:hypothetical protein
MRCLLAALFSLLSSAAFAQTDNVFAGNVVVCGGLSWIDVRCNGAVLFRAALTEVELKSVDSFD